MPSKFSCAFIEQYFDSIIKLALKHKVSINFNYNFKNIYFKLKNTIEYFCITDAYISGVNPSVSDSRIVLSHNNFCIKKISSFFIA